MFFWRSRPRQKNMIQNGSNRNEQGKRTAILWRGQYGVLDGPNKSKGVTKCSQTRPPKKPVLKVARKLSPKNIFKNLSLKNLAKKVHVLRKGRSQQQQEKGTNERAGTEESNYSNRPTFLFLGGDTISDTEMRNVHRSSFDRT